MSTVERVPKEVAFTQIGDIAEGAIGKTEQERPRLEEFTNRVGGGEYHVATNHEIPAGCIDGRCGCKVRPNTAGGSITMAVADDLLEQRFAGDGTTASMIGATMRHLSDQGLSIGGHTALELHGEHTSGCGANDQLAKIYDIMARKSDEIRALAAAFGITPSDDDHQRIVEGAARRTEFSQGDAVLTEMTNIAGDENIDKLEGNHQEVVAVINRKLGTTLNRDEIRAEFGDEYQAFNIDAWSFESAAKALYPDGGDQLVEQTVAAMAYYNLATSLALCGPNMRVVVLE